ncbi:MAG: hypothetical protein Kow0027_05050 [Saprospiraceae bacterium]
MLRQITLIVILAGTLGVCLRAQDPVFTQFNATPLAINPAFAGTTHAPRFAASYRNEWPSHSDAGVTAYATYAASYDEFFTPFNSGFGLMVMTDDAGGGLLKTSMVNAAYAYQVSVSNDFGMKLGIQAGFRQLRLDWDRLIFLDQLDPLTGPLDPSGNPNPTNEIPPESLTKTHFDVGAGLLVYTPAFYGGIALHHLTTPSEGFIRSGTGLEEGLPLRLTLQAGAELTLLPGNNRIPSTFIAPAILFVKQGDQGQVNVGTHLSRGPLAVGGFYRHAFTNSDALIGTVSFQYEVFKIGYSYDFTVASGLEVPDSGGSHEISLLINLDNSETQRRKRYAERYNDCFKIFR